MEPATYSGGAANSSLGIMDFFSRFAQHANAFAFDHMPNAVDSFAHKMFSSGSIIADATGSQGINSTITNASAHIAQSTTAGGVEAAMREGFSQSGAGDVSDGMLATAVQWAWRLKSFGGVFGYMTSKWALATFGVALFLNRTQFYASSRQPIHLQAHVRLVIYAIPLALLAGQTISVLQAMKCQTSPDFSLLRYGDPLKYLALDYGGEGGFLYWLSSTLLFWQDDDSCCQAKNMSLVGMEDKSNLHGTMSILFRFFLTLCTSQLFETLASSLEGRTVQAETSMTLFEHSLAFAECEAMISSSLGFGLFGPSSSTSSFSSTDKTGPAYTRGDVLQRLNVPPEVLLVCLISCFSHISSAILAVTGLRNKVRLINTGIWGCCYMSAFLWTIARVFTHPIDTPSDLGVLRFPTVCIIGFVPHILILFGILICGAIYSIGLILTAFSVPEEVGAGWSLRRRFGWAYGNLQANVQFSDSSAIRIRLSEDFYTSLLRAGFNILTAASEAVYLNEGSNISVAEMTWLERKRIDELIGEIEEYRAVVPGRLLGQDIARGMEFEDKQQHGMGKSPYARERKSRSTEGEGEGGQGSDTGLGIAERRGRMHLTFDFLEGIFWLLTNLYARLVVSTLAKVGLRNPPGWLRKAARSASRRRISPAGSPDRNGPREFWMLGADGQLTVPKDHNIDVEVETRRRLKAFGSPHDDETLSEHLYGWWRGGGWFGDLDESGAYELREMDDDTTSIMSMSTNASAVDDDERSDSGNRTPTQLDPLGDRSRETTPSIDGGLNVSEISRLLDPQSVEDREEARLLSYSLRADRPMTRNHFRRSTNLDRSRLVFKDSATPLTDDDRDEQALEWFILSRRREARQTEAQTWKDGAAGMGESGPHQPTLQPPTQDPFMQPEVPEVSPTATTHTSTREPEPNHQHGLQHHPADDIPPSAAAINDAAEGGLSSGSASRDQVARDAELAARLQEQQQQQSRRGGELGAAQVGGLNTSRSTPSPPARNRIDEYEKKASTPKKMEALGFEVIKKQRSPNDKRSPIAEMPNEVLTHALAHLFPTDLTSVALVSKRFHDLVTEPHAWRSAFSRYFPGPDSINALDAADDEKAQAVVRSERRAFTRLTPLASWRSEYIMRTRLLRSLERGKPVQMIASPSSTRNGRSHVANPVVTYSSQLFTTVNHIHATFGSGLNKRLPKFIHGADDVGTASLSDPTATKADNWGQTDPQFFLQFAERFPGDAQYGLGPGEVVGVPNVMDVSQPYGMVHGEGSPGGMVYYRSTEEMRGRFLQFSSAMSVPALGIPRIASTQEAVCSIWIAKSAAVPSLTEGLIGILSGSSLGVLTAYSLGSSGNANSREQRFGRGEMTARWVLSPGVPLIAIAVDNEHSLKRQAQNRIWAVVLNALGEIFYLTKFPKRVTAERTGRLDDEGIERNAWLTGRSVYWNIVEPSRRVAKPDPYADSRVDGSYSPRSSWNGMCLSKEQVAAETREIEAFVARKPFDFQKACEGWDMQRKLEVDFAGDDEANAGEAAVVFDCGVTEESTASAKRYTRCRFQDRPGSIEKASPPATTLNSKPSASPPSLFGGATSPSSASAQHSAPSFSFESLQTSLSEEGLEGAATPRPTIEEWRSSNFSFGGSRAAQILATAVDSCTYATQTSSEDPLLSFSGRSTTSSPWLTPMSPSEAVANPEDIPGQRARLVAIGTDTGTVALWNMRAPVSKTAENTNVVEPIRIIYTDSPQISSLALSSLYLVHGGNDGLVQAWDLLASTSQPIRTLNSRFSSRARRRLVQAQASPQGVGINLFAAGAICLDPDPTVLRGMVSLGTHLRYWHYSSSAADQYKSHKRRLRRSERGSNNGGERFSGATRSNLKNYIDNERFELDREKEQRHKEAQRLAGRYGTELLGNDVSEEEMVAYASMLSQEAHEQDLKRRASDTSANISTAVADSSARDSSIWSSDTATPTGSLSPHITSPASLAPKSDDEYDADVAEAIRLSLAAEQGGGHEIPIRQAKGKGRRGSPGKANVTLPPSMPIAGASNEREMSDLEFAMQLSLAEEESKVVGRDGRGVEGGFSEVEGRFEGGNSSNKGKGRLR
ncbi:hypothetical protein MBLNU230_g2942t1 [Neophaeotheca triangularis]